MELPELGDIEVGIVNLFHDGLVDLDFICKFAANVLRHPSQNEIAVGIDLCEFL